MRGNDTDIAFVLAATVNNFSHMRVWYDFGVDNNRRYIDMTSVVNGVEHIEALIGIYLFTGCDYSPAFHRKGKIKPAQIMLKDQKST